MTKFIHSKNIDDYEVLTDSGWQDVVAIHETIPYHIWTIITETHSLKCADDHIVFLEDYSEIFAKDLSVGQKIHTDTGAEKIISLSWVETQVNMFDLELKYDTDHRYFTNGILSHNTTCYTIYCLWQAIFFPEKKIMIAANKHKTSIEVLDRIRIGYEYLPRWIKPSVTVYNKAEMAFGNKACIKAFATSSSAARGFTCSTVIIDEIAFIPKNITDEFFASVMPVISSSKKSKAIIVSTPNGAEGLFYETWQQAMTKDKTKNKECWTPFKIDWWEVPGRDEEWKEKQIATIGINRWKQEFCNEFLSSSTFNRLIPDDIIEQYKRKLSTYRENGVLKGKHQQIISEANKKAYDFTMWHEFEACHTYVASADIAEGTGGDNSVLYIFDITNIHNIVQCVKLSSNTMSTVEFAFVSNRILNLFNNPFFICEANGVGSGFLASLNITYGYQNIVREGKDNKLGISSHVQVKGKACVWLKEMFTTDGVNWVLYDNELLDEMVTFIKKESKVHVVYSAMGDLHDDHIMALCWAAWVLNPDIIESYYVVTETYTTSLDKVLPKTIMPLYEYLESDVGKVVNDPLYKDFLAYKGEVVEKLADYRAKKTSIISGAPKNNPLTFDNLFFNDRSSGEDWSGSAVITSPVREGSGISTTSNKPSYFIV